MQELGKLTVCMTMFICPVTTSLPHLSSIDYILQLSVVYILTIATSLMHSLSEREQQYKHEMCVYFTKICLHQERVYMADIFFTASLHTFMLWSGFVHQNVAHAICLLIVCLNLPHLLSIMNRKLK